MANGTSIELVGPVKFKGDLSDGKNLSAVGRVGELLVVAGDEDDRLQILRRHGDEYELLADRAVPMNAAGEEADVEGIACEGDLVYAVGSHAAKRTKVKETESRAENRRRLEAPEPRSAFRDVLVRFRLAADGSHSDYKPTTLRPLIDGTKVLEPFTHICCKENGIDIEGLAVKDGGSTSASAARSSSTATSRC